MNDTLDEAKLLQLVDEAFSVLEKEQKIFEDNPGNVLPYITANNDYQEAKHKFHQLTGKIYSPPWLREMMEKSKLN